MSKIVRKVKGGAWSVDQQEAVRKYDKNAKPSSGSQVKGAFGRKPVLVEWENTDTGETLYIELLPLRPGELRILGGKVFTQPVFDKILADQIDAENLSTELGISEFEVMERYVQHKADVAIAVLIDEELKDRDWLLDEADEKFLDLIYNVGIGGVPQASGGVAETTTVDTFSEVDNESRQ